MKRIITIALAASVAAVALGFAATPAPAAPAPAAKCKYGTIIKKKHGKRVRVCRKHAKVITFTSGTPATKPAPAPAPATPELRPCKASIVGVGTSTYRCFIPSGARISIEGDGSGISVRFLQPGTDEYIVCNGSGVDTECDGSRTNNSADGFTVSARGLWHIWITG
jgi:hypothetical protein